MPSIDLIPALAPPGERATDPSETAPSESAPSETAPSEEGASFGE